MNFKDELKKIVKETKAKGLHVKLKRLNVEELKQLTKFLPNDATIGQRVFHIINEKEEIDKCPYCNENKRWNDNRKFSISGYINTCNKKICKDKYQKEFNSPFLNVKKKYGVDNISQTKEWHDKVKKTNLKKRGVEWNTQSDKLIKARQESWKENGEEQMSKRIETNNKLYGVDHSLQRKDVREKIEKTNLKRYGVKIPIQSDEILDKVKQTNKDKYGGWYCATPECQDKKYQRKEFIFPSGKKVMVQGYEPQALQKLLKKYKESDLIVGNIEMEKHIGKIKYFTEDDKEHRYYPDIYIKSINKIVEVKSTYTARIGKEINELKKQACLDAKFNFEFMIIK